MVRNRRLSSQERKKEIRDSASRFFLDKGFARTTMEDVISGTTMSKGGVYHYYKNTIDILHDLMIEGNRHRIDIIRRAMEEFQGKDDLSLLSESIVDKMLGDNMYMEIYVIFLIESKRNERLRELFLKLREESSREIYELGAGLDKDLLNLATDDFIVDFINSIILGSDILHARNIFLENRDILISMVKLYLQVRLKFIKERRKENG